MNLLSFVSSSVSEVIGTLTQEQNLLEELVHAPIQKVIEEISGGVWTGDGATAFVDELNSQFLPTSLNTSETIGGMVTSITNAAEIIEQADAAASAVVDGLVDTFSSIF